MDQMRVDLGILTETKLNHSFYTRQCCDYTVIASKATSASQGGVALFYHSHSVQWTIEGVQTHGPNVISCTLISGPFRWTLLGIYIPPSDCTGDTLHYLEEAVHSRCHHPIILLGDINVDLLSISDTRSDDIATVLAILGLVDVSRFFSHPKGRWTWSQVRNGRYVHSVTDCILAEHPDTFSRWAVKQPRYYSDHRALIAEILLAPPARHCRYVRRRKRLPFCLQWPLSKMDIIFQQLSLLKRPSPSKKQQRARSWISSTTWTLIDRKADLSRLLRAHNPDTCITRHTSNTSLPELIERLRFLTIQDTTDSIQDLSSRFASLTLQDNDSTIPSPHSSSSSFLIDSSHSSSPLAPTLCPHQRSYCQLSKEIRRALRTDRRKRADRVSKHIESLMLAHDIHGAFLALRGWYRDFGLPHSKPLSCDLLSQRQDFASLLSAQTIDAEPLPIHVTPFPINDDPPTEDEIDHALHQMRRLRAPGPSGIRVEDLLFWRNKIPLAWDHTVWLVRQIFLTGEIPQALSLGFLALVPKAQRGKFRGISLLEVVYKLYTTIIHLCVLSQVEFLDGIHGFRPHRGTGTAILEAKLLMQQAFLTGKPLYQIFLDLSKAYDSIDRSRALAILQGYGIGPNSLRFLRNVWMSQILILKNQGYFAPPFHPSRGTPQGDGFSPDLFNILVDCVLREWCVRMRVDPALLPAIILAIFYADDGRIAGYDPTVVQTGIDTFIELFARIGLQLNPTKTKFMVSSPTRQSYLLSDAAYRRRFDPSFPTSRCRSLTKIPCPICQRSLNSQYLHQHMREIHHSPVCNDQQPPAPTPRTYHLNFPSKVYKIPCPVLGCPASPTTRECMHHHFWTHHVQDTIIILQEGAFPRCPRCGKYTRSPHAKHFHTQSCQLQAHRLAHRLQYERHKQTLHQIHFHIDNIPIGHVTYFRYLGRILSADDCDDLAVHYNLQKARATWGRLHCILSSQGASSRVMAHFYLAIVHAQLLYGSDTWVLSQHAKQRLESFHHHCARHMTHHNIRKNPDGTWTCPPSQEVLALCNLSPISTYIAKRKTTLLHYATTNSALFSTCTTLPTTSHHLCWWHDSVDIQ